MLQGALTAGLNSVGVNVDDVGVLPTPGVAVQTRSSGAAAGVVVSASHNPAEDNGLKFFNGDGFKFHDAFEREVSGWFRSTREAEAVSAQEIGVVRNTAAEAMKGYRRNCVQAIGGARLNSLRVAVDCANGAAWQATPLTLQELGADVVARHIEPNGWNINAGCGSTVPMEIAKLVKSTQANVGITHDGDADRVLLCDETGSILDGDEIMAIVGLHLAQTGHLRGNAIVATVMSNMGLDEVMARAGVKVLRAAVGDRHVLELMRKNNLEFGGEQSGHFIFLRHSTTGDGLLSALLVLRIMQETGRPLSELRKVLKPYPQVQEAVRVITKPPIEMVPGLVAAIQSAEERLAGRGRVLVRFSGTEAKLRIMVEGADDDLIHELLEEIAGAAKKALGG
jgi:phosphoglucosamine mutase